MCPSGCQLLANSNSASQWAINFYLHYTYRGWHRQSHPRFDLSFTSTDSSACWGRCTDFRYTRIRPSGWHLLHFWPSYSHLCASQLVGLSRQDTFLASDPIWTKSPIGDGIDSLTPCSTPRSLQQTLQLPEVDKVDIQIMLDVPTSVIPKSRLQVGIFCTFDLHIPTYVLRSWLDYLVRIPSPLAILFGRNHHVSLAYQLQYRLAMSHQYLLTSCPSP